MKYSYTLLIALFTSFTFAQEVDGLYELDKAHSRLGFKIKHRDIVDVNGEFSSFTMNFTMKEEDWKNCKIELTAKTESINTGIEGRDNHLRSEDFFDSEKYPSITFQSEKMSMKKGNITIMGSLTMHGITQKVTLTGVVMGPKSFKDSKVIGMHLTGPVKRSDFKIGKISPGIADEVILHADIELVGE